MSTTLAASIAAVADLPPLVLLFVVAAAMVSALVRTLSGRPISRGARATTRRAATPSPFSYWYALVPFEDGKGAKERPVLVLRLDGTSARVLKVTSKDKSGRTNHRRVDTSRWDRPGRREGSWLQTDRVTTVPLSTFRRRLGDERAAYFRRELVRIHPEEFRTETAIPSADRTP
jgi:hypothetical protein